MRSKVIFFSLPVLFFCIFSSCSDSFKRDSVIPYTPIDTRINLSWSEYQDLKFSGRPVYILYSTPGAKLLGYNGNGIIVIKTDMDGYKCYDATCPNCIEADTHIEITAGEQLASCPNCKTLFFLPYGIALESDEDENYKTEVPSLQVYPVIEAGNLLIIKY